MRLIAARSPETICPRSSAASAATSRPIEKPSPLFLARVAALAAGPALTGSWHKGRCRRREGAAGTRARDLSRLVEDFVCRTRIQTR